MSIYDVPDLDDLQDAVHSALTSWGKIGSSEEELLGFLLLVQQERASIEGSLDPLKLRKATNIKFMPVRTKLTDISDRPSKIYLEFCSLAKFMPEI